MYKIKKIGIVLIGIFSVIGLVSAVNLYVFDEKKELEQDLVSIQRSIDFNKKDEDRFRGLWERSKAEREFYEGRKLDKTCTLARLKIRDGEQVQESTKVSCPTVFL